MRYQQASGVTAEPSGERLVLLDADGETLTTLNPTGALVWAALREPADLDGVVANLAAVFDDVDGDVLRADAGAFLEQLRDTGLVVDADARG